MPHLTQKLDFRYLPGRLPAGLMQVLALSGAVLLIRLFAGLHLLSWLAAGILSAFAWPQTAWPAVLFDAALLLTAWWAASTALFFLERSIRSTPYGRLAKVPHPVRSRWRSTGTELALRLLHPTDTPAAHAAGKR